MNQKMINCKTCGVEIAKSAKACPHCGAKNKVLHPVRGAIAGIVALFCCIIIISAMIGSGESSADTTSGNGSASQIESKEEPFIEISAHDLWTAYDENEVSADNLYKSEILHVTGTVSEIGKDIIAETPYVLLKAGDTYGIYSVQCYFYDSEEQSVLASLKDGDTVTIAGKCKGRTINVTLSDCSLID